MARPKKVISEKQVLELARIHCTVAEMAAVLDCSKDTLERRFAALIEKGRSDGRTSLRRKQFDAATRGKGNVTMLIWLGKQHLGQTDKPQEDRRGGKTAAEAWAEAGVVAVNTNGDDEGDDDPG